MTDKGSAWAVEEPEARGLQMVPYQLGETRGTSLVVPQGAKSEANNQKTQLSALLLLLVNGLCSLMAICMIPSLTLHNSE